MFDDLVYAGLMLFCAGTTAVSLLAAKRARRSEAGAARSAEFADGCACEADDAQALAQEHLAAAVLARKAAERNAAEAHAALDVIPFPADRLAPPALKLFQPEPEYGDPVA